MQREIDKIHLYEETNIFPLVWDGQRVKNKKGYKKTKQSDGSYEYQNFCLDNTQITENILLFQVYMKLSWNWPS